MRRVFLKCSQLYLWLMLVFGLCFAMSTEQPALAIYLLLPVIGILLLTILKQRSATLSAIQFWVFFGLLTVFFTLPATVVLVFICIMLSSGVTC